MGAALSPPTLLRVNADEETRAAEREELADARNDEIAPALLNVRLAAIDALPHVDPDCIDALEDPTRSRKREIAEAAEYAVEEPITNVEDE